ncbi:hypothetical protein Hanom_Chr17g01573211 [Helianthus anomalus]
MNIVDKQDVAKADENVRTIAGGETMKETLVEGEVHSYSSETESDSEVTKLAHTSYKASDEEDATYKPTPVEKEKSKKKGIRKHKAQPTGDVPKRQKARKVTTSIPEQILEIKRVESIEVEIPVQSEFKMATPPFSLIQQAISVQEEFRETTPEQPPKIVEESSSTTKKAPTPQSSSHGFLKVPSNLGDCQTSLEDFGDFFNDAKVNALSRKVGLLEKAKAKSEAKLKATKEKLKCVEAENVVLRNEILALNEKILDIDARYKAVNESHDIMLSMHCDLEVSLTNSNEILKKDVADLKSDKEINDEQIKMLYAVIEDRLGINVHAVFDEIEIQRDEARRMEKEKKNVEEALEALKDKGKGIIEVNVVEDDVNNEFALVPAQLFTMSEDDDDDDEELKEWFGDDDDDDDHHDDKGNDDDQGGTGGVLIGESTSGSKHVVLHKVISNTPIIIFLNHNVEEGELGENWTRESMLETLDMDDENFKFDIEEEIPTTPDQEYVFKMVDEADNFDDVIIEEGLYFDQDVPFHYTGQDDDFPTFDELFRSHNEDELRRKVAEKISTYGSPKTILKEDLLEEREMV